jgi:hypothetical protein
LRNRQVVSAFGAWHNQTNPGFVDFQVLPTVNAVKRNVHAAPLAWKRMMVFMQVKMESHAAPIAGCIRGAAV